MDKKSYRGIPNFVVDIQQSFNRVGDGTNPTKNGMMNLVIPTPLTTSALVQRAKRNSGSLNLKTNNFKSKTNPAISNTNYTINNINGASKTIASPNPANPITDIEPVGSINSAAQISTQQKRPISPVNMKTSTMTTVRMKNEEAVNDLRQRIPEIEKIFDVHTRIGNGTFSTVLLGTLKKERHLSEENQRKFAIKHHIPTSHPERIMRELQCMANIGGVDNVVEINCCMRCNESVAFIMPYMPHDRFHDFFSKMDLPEVQFYMKNLLLALRRVHRFNVIHRDVKPSNFLYNRSRRQFLLVDFGLAQQAPMPQTQVEPTGLAEVTQKLTRTSGGGGAGEGNKRAREEDDNEDNEGVLKSCLDTGSDTGAMESEPKTVISGVTKRLRCTGPHGDQQVPASGAIRNESGGNFKMPLKQLNEITMPGGKTLAVTTISNSGSNVSGIATQAAPGVTTGSETAKYNTNRNLSAMNAAKCFCYGNAQVCNSCLIKKEIHASRAGTPGYRPPEVLLKYANQTTAVDIWAAGVIFLSILSSVYPFFKAPTDFFALAEMVTIFGDKSIRNTAYLLDRLVTLSHHSKPLDLRKLCVRFRNRTKFSSLEMLKRHQSADGTCEICKNCDQYYFNCLCLESSYKTEPIDSDDVFPASAYDLLHRLLEVNPHKRITADQALQHPFFNEIDKNIKLTAANQQSSTITAPKKSSPILARKQ